MNYYYCSSVRFETTCTAMDSFCVLLLWLVCISGCVSLSFGFNNSNVKVSQATKNGPPCRIPNDTCETLYLLNILPYPDGNGPSLFDRGDDLVPAGLLAAKHINSHPSILSGYKLELINAESEPCDRSTAITGQINFLRNTLHDTDSTCVVGVIGLYCSTVTRAVSLIASYPSVSYIQVAASTSPLHRNKDERFQHVFHTIASSTVFNEAVVAMMKKLGWKQIGQIYEPLGLYLQSTANDFAAKLHEESDLELITQITFTSSPRTIFNTLNAKGARISYWSLTEQQAAQSLCEAYSRRFLWPGFIYIQHDHTAGAILAADVPCTREEMLQALEGTFFVRYRLDTGSKSELVSGVTYDEYHNQYLEELNNYGNDTGRKVGDTIWANPLYDQVWAFALALNSSLGQLSRLDLPFSGYRPARSETAQNVSSILESNLKSVCFQGVTGAIEFSDNLEVKMFVNIYQVRNGTEVLVGVYNPYEDYFIPGKSSDTIIPEDRFDTKQVILPIWMGMIVFLTQGVLFILVSFNLVCFLVWRNEKGIKATGLPLSMLTIAGCYILCLAPIAQTIGAAHVSILDNTSFAVLCNLEKWLQLLGIPLIFASLFVRLLRVFHLFRVNMKRTGKYWSDSYLFIYILLICSVPIFILIVWAVVDPLHREVLITYVESAQPPHYVELSYCNSNNIVVWIIVHFAFLIVLVLMVMFLSIQTRHIKRQQFKDTKKVNVFVFGSVIIAALCIPLWFVLTITGIGLGSFIVNWLSYSCVTLHCQLCLFVPKTVPLFCRKRSFSVSTSALPQY